MNEDTETYEAARSRLAAQGTKALLELAMLIEQSRHGTPAGQKLHDDLEAGATRVEFALSLEATSTKIIGIEHRGPANRCICDVLLFAAPGS